MGLAKLGEVGKDPHHSKGGGATGRSEAKMKRHDAGGKHQSLQEEEKGVKLPAKKKEGCRGPRQESRRYMQKKTRRGQYPQKKGGLGKKRSTTKNALAWMVKGTAD